MWWQRIVWLWGLKVGHLTRKKGTFLLFLQCYYCEGAVVTLLLLRSTAGFSPCCQLMLMMPSPRLSLRTLTASPLMDSKQLVSARLTLSYHNLIILMILLPNFREASLAYTRRGGGGLWLNAFVWISHESEEMSKGYNIQCVCSCVCSNMSLSADKHNPAAPTTAWHRQQEGYGKLLA